MAEETTTPPPTNGNGRLQRLDWILGSIMGICLMSALICVALGAKYHPVEGNWTMLNDTRAAMFGFAEKIMIGYFALAIPKIIGK